MVPAFGEQKKGVRCACVLHARLQDSEQLLNLASTAASQAQPAGDSAAAPTMTSAAASSSTPLATAPEPAVAPKDEEGLAVAAKPLSESLERSAEQEAILVAAAEKPSAEWLARGLELLKKEGPRRLRAEFLQAVEVRTSQENPACCSTFQVLCLRHTQSFGWKMGPGRRTNGKHATHLS